MKSGQLKTGLIGNPLGHSWSPRIHAELGDYEYTLMPMEEEAVAPFLEKREFDAINVTIPYKKTVMPYLDTISDEARRIGSVNTVVKDGEGLLHGYNTDYAGFSYMLDRKGIRLDGRKVVILGSGGASVTAQCVARDRGARQVVVISRSGEDNYSNLERHRDADVLVNTTPVGMFPKNGESPVSLDSFPALSAMVDMIYNPARTALILDAEDRGIPCTSGLPMLVAQAVRASELFTGNRIPAEKTEEVIASVSRSMRNIILIGMPGCGKSTLGRLLSERLDRPLVDLDTEIVRSAEKSIPDIFREDGEDAFRELETAVLRAFSKQSSLVLATGGGAVIRPENRRLFRENGTTVLLMRALGELDKDGRPLSQAHTAEELWNARKSFYLSAADITVESAPTPEETLARTLAALGE
ncbi:MAG: shikimate kinase [Ruminococcaceae bacterium]|jgi:shikimate dehydrogenase|nr:shikimate kinase [Oscillospiraceae bacterium]